MTRDLVWAVKRSFVWYVEAIGQVEALPPASRDDDGAFRFPADADGGFGGGVAFRAHQGALHVVLLDPRVEDSRLSIDLVDHDRPQGRVVLAEIQEGGSTVLLPSGAVVFDFTYPIGTGLAPILVDER